MFWILFETLTDGCFRLFKVVMKREAIVNRRSQRQRFKCLNAYCQYFGMDKVFSLRMCVITIMRHGRQSPGQDGEELL